MNNTEDFSKVRFQRVEGKKNVVLVCCGAYNPIHNGHVNMMDLAKEYVESRGKHVVCGGFLSPSHDSYLRMKLRDKLIESKHRVRLMELALQDSEYFSVLRYNTTRKCNQSRSAVVNFVDTSVRRQFPNEKFQPFFVCGADHFLTCSVGRFKKSGVVVVNRDGCSWETVRRKKREYGKGRGFIFLCPKKTMACSSSKIRSLIAKGEEVPTDLISNREAVEYYKDYLKNHKNQQQ